ncbi:hypothetical protein CCB80_14140 [Armatimonadetes bacterium Uphvl-Ar1]|nr:hypothetical protein CCB80_14140 [Armatimonadetes bacterium Uphvl-Ar1]
MRMSSLVRSWLQIQRHRNLCGKCHPFYATHVNGLQLRVLKESVQVDCQLFHFLTSQYDIHII